jgi:hypothetical protein
VSTSPFTSPVPEPEPEQEGYVAWLVARWPEGSPERVAGLAEHGRAMTGPTLDEVLHEPARLARYLPPGAHLEPECEVCRRATATRQAHGNLGMRIDVCEECAPRYVEASA